MKRYQWLLFDADGTLFDYDEAEAMALRMAFESFSIQFQDSYLEIYRKINTEIWIDFEKGLITSGEISSIRFGRLADELELSFDLSAFSDNYLGNLGKQACLMEGAEELITDLAETYQMAVITNGLTKVQRSRFSRTPMMKYFKEIFISQEMGVQKPDTAYFERVFEGINHPKKEETLVIGDNPSSDIAGANAFGLDACWINPNGKSLPKGVSAEYVIKSLEELRPVLLG